MFDQFEMLEISSAHQQLFFALQLEHFSRDAVGPASLSSSTSCLPYLFLLLLLEGEEDVALPPFEFGEVFFPGAV